LGGEDFRIRRFASKHARHFGKEFGQRNVIFTVQTAGLTFCHTGDTRAELPEGMPDVVEKVDVLMVPVDEANHLLTHREVDDVVRVLDPSIVIPTHYRVPGLTDPSTPLGGIGSWLAVQPNVRCMRPPHVELSLSDLPAEREVWVFEGFSEANRPG
jgi:L-ascorbate metabolism protein UlaG (beta-lactamase superfamily)